ncbi:MAG: hypothetical protein KDC05_17535, partial [Bacteroidales bacterium]|nr:hypothetical protein [Bacteroidales bacterium]
WQFTDQTKKFDFVIDSVKRSEEIIPVVLSWDGDPVNVKEYGTDTTRIPAHGDFQVVDITVIQQPEQYIRLQFSDPIMASQNLDGIISLKSGGSLKFEVKSNEVKAFPQNRLSGAQTIQVASGIKNAMGFKMKASYSNELSFRDVLPEVRLIGKGVILPESDGLIFPFEAVNLSAVDVTILKIFENNVPQFLQVNQLNGDREIRRVGRPVLRKKVPLNVNPELDAGQWNAYSIDLAPLIAKEPGAIYQVELSFKKDYSLFHCDDETDEDPNLKSMDDQPLADNSWDDGNYYYYYDYYPAGYDWNERDNPCHISFYNRNRWVTRNVLASNLGIIAKGGSGEQLRIAVTDLRTTQPLPGVTVELYNYQQQKIGESKTDPNGFTRIDMKSKPWFLIARNGEELGYMRLDDGSSLSLSMFEVNGQRVQEGIKGFLYGERGVWRPGDTLFLNFILDDKMKSLPDDYPVVFELKNPQGQLVNRLVKTSGVDGFYNFTTTTPDDAPTGLWSAIVTVGPGRFHKTIRIETVKPNRLKLNLEYDQDILSFNTRKQDGTLTVKWLHGAVARNLKARVMVTLNSVWTSFENYKDYVFYDATQSFNPEEITLFDGKLDEKGQAKVKADLGMQQNAPGMLKASFMVRAFEEGGDFSTDFFSMDYAPYPVFVGLKLPKTGTWGNEFMTDSSYMVDIATVDEKGNPVSVPRLEVSVYKISWRWWWDVSYRNRGHYIQTNYQDLVMTYRTSTTNGRGEAHVMIEYPEWGRYLIQVKDPEGGHSSSQVFYVDWPDWVSRDNRQQPEGAKVMNFTLDKE